MSNTENVDVAKKETSKKDTFGMLGGAVYKGIVLFMIFGIGSISFQFLKLYEVSVEAQRIEANIKIEEHEMWKKQVQLQMELQTAALDRQGFSEEEKAQLEAQLEASQVGMPSKLVNTGNDGIAPANKAVK